MQTSICVKYLVYNKLWCIDITRGLLFCMTKKQLETTNSDSSRRQDTGVPYHRFDTDEDSSATAKVRIQSSQSARPRAHMQHGFFIGTAGGKGTPVR